MGEIMRRLTRAAPVPWPLNVMRLESPPKTPMLSFSHSRAATCYRHNRNMSHYYRANVGLIITVVVSYLYPISRNCLASGWHFCFCHGLGRESDWLPSVGILLLDFNHFEINSVPTLKCKLKSFVKQIRKTKLCLKILTSSV